MIPTLDVELECGGEQFSFHLCRRKLDMGLADLVDYYWMDSRPMRQGRGGPNFQACVDWWWKTVEAVRETRLPENEVNLVLAECYPLVNRCRAMQDIYLDAHLNAKADRNFFPIAEARALHRNSERTYSLPPEESQRLRDIAHTRDSEQVRLELETLFMGKLPPSDQMPTSTKAVQAWINNGRDALKDNERDGLRDYLQNDLNEQMGRLRRRGNVGPERLLLNLFACQCKVAFYLYYMSAWIILVLWLKENKGINAVSERFLRIWHNQNQPCEEENKAGGHRDAFCGQILAMHPLSGIILTSPGMLWEIGKLINLPHYDELIQQNRIGDTPEYWDMVAVILIAAHEYYYSHTQWEAKRGQNTFNFSKIIKDAEHDDAPISNIDEIIKYSARDDAPISNALVLEDYAGSREIVCSQCASSLQYISHVPPASYDVPVDVHYKCSTCKHQEKIPITFAELAEYLKGD